MSTSKISFLVVAICILWTGLLYYPKWQQPGTNATISWDVSGYYSYLPAIFIYKDCKKLEWLPPIIEKYKPTPHINQAFEHESGNYVMKYSIGQAVMYLPAFIVAHTWASATGTYEADGFSHPYQLCMSIWSLVVAIFGIWMLRKLLLQYFSEKATAITLLAVTIGSNYLVYSAISGAMTHNFLFTLYTLLIWQTTIFYQKPDFKKAIGIGLLVGIMALTRPTELLAALIPLLWGVECNIGSVKSRFLFYLNSWKYFLMAILAMLAVSSMQFLYWKFSAGEWIVYSYEEQGFSWLRPHVFAGMFSYKSGWLTYSPMMVLSLLGFIFLRKYKPVFLPMFLFASLFMYVTFAWDIWWYGGSLGQRAMVQSYAVLAFPFAALIEKLSSSRVFYYPLIGFMVVATYMSLWFGHNAHVGKMMRLEQMTKAYYWEVVGKWEVDRNDLKLLDTDEQYSGDLANRTVILVEDFEDLPAGQCELLPIQGVRSLCLNGENQGAEPIIVNLPLDKEWIRVYITARIDQREWEWWEMTQMIVKQYRQDKEAKVNFIRLHRHMDHGGTKRLYMDTKIADGTNRAEILFWNAGSDVPILIDDLEVLAFDEE